MTLTNTYFTDNNTETAERDFVLAALATGARIGYDASGTTWAIKDEGHAPQGITWIDNPTIHAFGGEKGPNGEFIEWAQPGSLIGDCFSVKVFTLGGVFEGMQEMYALCYCAEKGWSAENALLYPDEPVEYFETPTIPANRIERDAMLLAVAIKGGHGRIGDVALPNGDLLEWTGHESPGSCQGFGTAILGRFIFTLGDKSISDLAYEPMHGWAVNEYDPKWYDSPTIPANRIEEMAREACAVGRTEIQWDEIVNIASHTDVNGPSAEELAGSSQFYAIHGKVFESATGKVVAWVDDFGPGMDSVPYRPQH